MGYLYSACNLPLTKWQAQNLFTPTHIIAINMTFLSILCTPLKNRREHLALYGIFTHAYILPVVLYCKTIFFFSAAFYSCGAQSKVRQSPLVRYLLANSYGFFFVCFSMTIASCIVFLKNHERKLRSI